MRFAAFVGGEPSIGVFPHIHGLLELPQNTTPEEIVEYLASLWSRKLKKKLKQSVKSSVKYEVMRGAKGFSSYCSRNEGTTFSLGDEKLILNKSFYFLETLPKLL
jgi:REP element-mobilizing transposase RayT